jgi:hypothetical protein
MITSHGAIGDKDARTFLGYGAATADEQSRANDAAE